MRLAFINSFLFFSFFIFFITEIFSLFKCINDISLFFSYFILLIIFFSLPRKNCFPNIDLDLFEKILLFTIVFISLITLITALASPPNTWDSMTYHMSRVEFWIQNKAINFYNTNNLRQNIFSPLSEFIVLHLQVLSKSDIYANLVSWISLIVSMVTVSLICKEFGLDRKLQILGAFFICSLPSMILQASSTKNDIVLSTFILIFYFYQLIMIRKNSYSIIFLSGITLGLSLLTKGTSYIFIFAISTTCFLYSLIRKTKNFKYIILNYFITFSIGLLINTPHFIRNYITYGDILGIKVLPSHTNDIFSVGTIFSNLIRHVAYQFGSNFSLINWYLYQIVKTFLGENISDPRTSFLDRDFRPPFQSLSEEHAGNIVHTLMIMIILTVSLFLIKKFRKIQLTSLVIMLMSILLYCLLLKWQPWTNKLIPVFVISAPFIMITLKYFSHNKNYIITLYFAFTLMFLNTFPYLFLNESRPLLSFNQKSVFSQKRILNYFNSRPNLYFEYESIIDQVKHTKNGQEISIALHIGGDSWDYPLWVMIKQKFDKSSPHIFHLVKKDFEILENIKKYPDYLIYENRLTDNLNKIEKFYRIKKSTKNFSILEIISN